MRTYRLCVWFELHISRIYIYRAPVMTTVSLLCWI